MLQEAFNEEISRPRGERVTLDDLGHFFNKEYQMHDQVYGRKALPTPGQRYIDTRTTAWKQYAKRRKVLAYLEKLAMFDKKAARKEPKGLF